MLNPLTTAKLQAAKTMIDQGDLVGFYNYMYAQGHGYANLAKGVVECTLPSGGSTALQFITQAAKDQGVNLTAAQVAQIEIDMAYGYANKLIDIAEASGGVLGRVINFQETLAFHSDVLVKAQLDPSTWTLYTPSLYLSPAELDTNFAASTAVGANGFLDSEGWLKSMGREQLIAKVTGLATSDMQKIQAADAMYQWIAQVLTASARGVRRG